MDMHGILVDCLTTIDGHVWHPCMASLLTASAPKMEMHGIHTQNVQSYMEPPEISPVKTYLTSTNLYCAKHAQTSVHPHLVIHFG